MNLPATTIALLTVAVVLFSLLCGCVVTLLAWYSNRGDPAGAALRGLTATGMTIAGAFGVIGAVALLM